MATSNKSSVAKEYLVYCFTNKINNKVYIGATKASTPNRRWIYHKRDSKRNLNIPLYKAMNKYGIENFELSVIKSDIETVEELMEMEIFYIKNYYSLLKLNVRINYVRYY